MLALNHLVGFNASRRPAVIDYRASSNDTVNRSVYTFTAQDIGAAQTDRIVAVAAYATGGGAISCTIGGIAATKTADLFDAGIFWAIVPTGTTASIVITLASGTAHNCQIGVWRIVDYINPLPFHSLASFGSGSSRTTDSIAVNIPSGGVAIYFGNRLGTTTVIWSGATERYDVALETSDCSSAADFTANISEAPHTATATFASATFGGWCGLSWR